MDNESKPSRAVQPILSLIMIVMIIGMVLAMFLAVTYLVGNSNYWKVPEVATSQTGVQGVLLSGQSALTITPTRPAYTPTPDPPHAVPPLRTQTEQYTVEAGDTLGLIAAHYGINLDQLISENSLINPNVLEVGQVLTVPVPTPDINGSYYKVIPDSELVYGPTSTALDVIDFVTKQGAYLAGYTEEVNGALLSGAQIVDMVAKNYSVNPRILLAILEYQSSWLTQSNPPEKSLKYPIADLGEQAKGLYIQLNWLANALNQGYYLWRVNGVSTWILGDGSIVRIDPTINAGTAGIQNALAPLYDLGGWTQAVSEEGLERTFTDLFGYPFSYSYEPILTPGLQQPDMQLPFESGVVWAFTGGAHGGWGNGSGWAALDFAPPGNALGCVLSDEWVVAVADGLIVRAGDGAVIQDLDGDGNEGTGWVVLYMHIETRDRVEPGTYLKAGEKVGHPSCEGGVSSGTHVHLARKYNGEWIPADQDIPFNLDGWISSGSGQLYDGYMTRGDTVIEAYAGRDPKNEIQR